MKAKYVFVIDEKEGRMTESKREEGEETCNAREEIQKKKKVERKRKREGLGWGWKGGRGGGRKNSRKEGEKKRE